MPVYLFTWHAYGSWMPDRAEGYVHYKRGYEESSARMAQRYREMQRLETVSFDEPMQQELLSCAVRAESFQKARLHAAATDSTHLHVLLSWNDPRTMDQLKRSFRRSLSSELNGRLQRRWFSAGGHWKPVRDRAHFDYLISVYLPGHRGWKYDEKRGIYQ